MAIDYGISSLDAGASDITYSGNEGPKSPQEEQQMQMASLMQEYKDYVMQQEEAGRPAMPFEEWVRSIQSPMAEGGIARLGYANGQLVKPGPGRPGYGGPQDWGQEERAEKVAAGTATPRERDLHYGNVPGGQGTYNPYTEEAQRETRDLNKRVEENRIKRLEEEKAKEEQSLLERYNKWHREKQKSYYAKNYKKALEKFVTSNMKTDLPDWYDEDTDVNELYDWIEGQDLPEKYSDLEGRDLNPLWEKHGYVPTSSTLPGWFGAVIPSKLPTFDEVKAIKERYTKPVEGNWLEEMKVRAPNQYAVYTGTNYDPIRKTFNPREGGGGQARDLIPYPYQTASAPAPVDDTTPGWQAPEIPVESIRFAADGGRMGYAGGGIADLRQGYFLGKLVKKAGRALKKVVKSPIGKMALMGGLGWAANAGMFPGAFGKNWINKGMFGKEGFLAPLLRKKTAEGFGKYSLAKLGILGASAYPLIKGMGDDEDDDFTQTDLYKRWLAQKQGWDQTFAPVGDQANWQPIRFADGGRTGYAGGGYYDEEEEDHRSAALSAMYRSGAQEGGLMDLGGMEKDYRQEGGFVPIGGQERADDVPARLSKNEFVFTADAVRAAGGGDIDKGAEVMENVMENLEKGGNVSEESQGLEGARNMFATSQRLEGVL